MRKRYKVFNKDMMIKYILLKCCRHCIMIFDLQTSTLVFCIRECVLSNMKREDCGRNNISSAMFMFVWSICLFPSYLTFNRKKTWASNYNISRTMTSSLEFRAFRQRLNTDSHRKDEKDNNWWVQWRSFHALGSVYNQLRILISGLS